MHWTDFTLQLMDRLLWPLTLFGFFIFFRKSIAELLPNLKRLKYQDLEVEFERELLSASQAAQQLLDHDHDDRLISKLRDAITHHPQEAILEAWKAVETAAKSVINNYQGQVNWDNKAPYKHLEEILTHENLLDKETAELFSKVRLLRNKVSHAPGFEVRSSEAVQYIELCDQLIHHLNEL
ncbi:MAG: hypothetical protein ACRBBW_01650 [Cellvibrionaceae bacterium]